MLNVKFDLTVVLFVFCFALIINWPSIFTLFDGKTSPVKFWIYLTCGALSLHLPMWIVLLFFTITNLTKMDIFVFTSSILLTIIGEFSITGLLNSFMILQETQYVGKIIYIIILTSAGLCFSMFTLFLSTLHLIESYITFTRSGKYTTIIYACLLSLAVGVCAVSILNTISDNSPVRLNLLISLSGLIFFVFLWLVIVCGFTKGGSFPNWAKLSAAIYILIYSPFFTYWTIRSLYKIYLNMDHLGIDGTVMIFFTYSVTFCSLFPGTLTFSLLVLGLILGIIVLFIYLIFRILCPTYLNSILESFFAPANDPMLNSYHPLDHPLKIILEEEHFDPSKHRKSFIEGEVCSICIEGFESEQLVTYWPICKHVFHQPCLSYWIQKNQTCPNCKQHYQSIQPIQDGYDPPLDM